jgi:phenylacetate-CoA ligase
MTVSSVDEGYERYAATLERTQWLPRERLNAYRDDLLRRLAKFASENSPFYRERLRPLFHAGGETDLRAWREVPILTRKDAQIRIDQILVERAPDYVGPVSELQTSGTTAGEGMRLRTCYLAQMAEACMMHRMYRWNHFDLSAPMGSIRSYRFEGADRPDGWTEDRWAYPGPRAPHHKISFRTPIPKLIDWLMRVRPKYLITLPSVAHEIALHPDAGRVGEIGLRAIVGTGELVTDDAREAIRRNLKCEILLIYGAGEIGAIAVQSPIDHSLLLCDESTLVELVNVAGNPVAPGETGRVLLTSLYNYAAPFIRYEIGDYATLASSPCPSGRTLGRVLRVEGRSRNALKTHKGENVWQSQLPTAELLRLATTRHFQIRQPDLETIEFHYIPETETSRPDHDALTRVFAAKLGAAVKLQLIPVTEIPRAASGKYERIVSHVA